MALVVLADVVEDFEENGDSESDVPEKNAEAANACIIVEGNFVILNVDIVCSYSMRATMVVIAVRFTDHRDERVQR